MTKMVNIWGTQKPPTSPVSTQGVVVTNIVNDSINQQLNSLSTTGTTFNRIFDVRNFVALTVQVSVDSLTGSGSYSVWSIQVSNDGITYFNYPYGLSTYTAPFLTTSIDVSMYAYVSLNLATASTYSTEVVNISAYSISQIITTDNSSTNVIWGSQKPLTNSSSSSVNFLQDSINQQLNSLSTTGTTFNRIFDVRSFVELTIQASIDTLSGSGSYSQWQVQVSNDGITYFNHPYGNLTYTVPFLSTYINVSMYAYVALILTNASTYSTETINIAAVAATNFGTTGTSGYSGYSGAGQSGYSGYSGYSGPVGMNYRGVWSSSSLTVYFVNDVVTYTSAGLTATYICILGNVSANDSAHTPPTGTTFWALLASYGTSGYSGYSGAGQSGYSGYSGAAGAGGSSGYSGYSGAGTSGYSGYSGAGTSGYSGYSGVSGYSGYRGLSGYSGYSGKAASPTNPNYFTTGTGATIAVPSGCTRAWVRGVGAGAGGGYNLAGYGTSGGSGALFEKLYTGLVPGNNLTYTVGALGAGASSAGGNANGTAGGDTTITDGTTVCTAHGGAAGKAVGNPTAATATNGDLNVTGAVGTLYAVNNNMLGPSYQPPPTLYGYGQGGAGGCGSDPVSGSVVTPTSGTGGLICILFFP